MEGLLGTMLESASDLSKLSELTDEQLLRCLKPLKLRSLKIRKIHAAIIALRAEREAFNRTTFAEASPGGTPDGVPLRAPRDLELPHHHGHRREHADDEGASDEEDKGPSPTAAAAHDFIEPPHPRLGVLVARRPGAASGSGATNDASPADRVGLPPSQVRCLIKSSIDHSDGALRRSREAEQAS